MTTTDNSIVPIIALNWNGYDDTVECLDSLLDSTELPIRVVLVDNGSANNEAQRLIARFANERRVTVLPYEQNFGFTAGVNRTYQRWAEQEEPSQYVALLNNDTVVEPAWLDQLIDTAHDSRAGIVASCMIRYDDRAQLDNAGHIMLNTGEILPRGIGQQPDGRYSVPEEVLGACAGAALYSTEMLQDIGLFDEFFETGYEDAEHGLRAVLAGYKVVYEPRAIVYHKVSASIDKIRDFNYAVRIQRNINYTMLKLLPWQLLLISAPFIFLKQISILLVSFVLFRWRLFAAHAKALWLTLFDLPTIWRARKSVRHLRRIPWYQLARRQQFFLPVYWQYFKRYILGREKTVFER